MRDNQIYIMLRDLLLTGLNERGFSDVGVKQNYQPTQQGRPNQSTVFMTKILDRRVGSRKISEKYNARTDEIVRTETQVLESTFQFNALASERNPSDDDEVSAADILKTVAAIMQDPDFVMSIRKKGAQILRILDIRNTPVENDRNQFEIEPSFDVVLTHKDVFIKTVPALTNITFGIRRI